MVTFTIIPHLFFVGVNWSVFVIFAQKPVWLWLEEQTVNATNLPPDGHSKACLDIFSLWAIYLMFSVIFNSVCHFTHVISALSASLERRMDGRKPLISTLVPKIFVFLHEKKNRKTRPSSPALPSSSALSKPTKREEPRPCQPGKQTFPANSSPTMVKNMERINSM